MRFIACADLHFSDKQPTSHTASNWLDFQCEQLKQLAHIQSIYKCPILCAGDIFHRSTVSLELLNMVIDNLPRPFYCVPGQHDLPYHSEEQITKSAYYNLVKHNGIFDLSDSPEYIDNPKTGLQDTRVIGMPFGRDYPDLTTLNEQYEPLDYDVLLVHRYCYTPNNSPIPLDKVSETDHAKSHYKHVNQYQLAIFGDNHISFQVKNILNCGTFMQRNANDAFGHVWLINDDWTAEPWIMQEESLVTKAPQKDQSELQNDFDCSDYINTLKETSTDFDFDQAIQTYFKANNTPKDIRDTIFNIINQSKGA
jgi:hypothetical protein